MRRKQGENYQHGVFEFSVPSGKVAYQKQRQEHIQEEYIRKTKLSRSFIT